MRFSRSNDEYARVAPFFDVMLGPFLNVVQHVVCRQVARLGLRTVLDICCGTGRQVRLLAESGVQGVGIDRSPAMLDVARRKSRGNGFWVLGDARSLPFRDGSFDGALLSLALHENAPEARGRMLREASRILRPRGKLLVVDYLAPPHGRRGPATLAARCIEWMAGERHYRNFRDFLLRGGSVPLLSSQAFQIMEMTVFGFGLIGVAVCIERKPE